MAPSIDPAPHALEVAPTLLGMVLQAGDRAGRIVEVEAYGGPDDPASHAYRGETPRNGAMFGPPGTLYVYRIYGLHWCANVACGAAGDGAAVLIRALEPLVGVEAMAVDWPKAKREIDLCSGPGKLCAALGIDGDDDGLDLADPSSRVRLLIADVDSVSTDDRPAVTGPRIGITKAAERPWRFAIAGNPNVSRPRPPGWPAPGR